MCCAHAKKEMEKFEGIYLNLSKKPGQCRVHSSGLGWKLKDQEDTFTLGGDKITGAQWSRAAKGHEVKIFSPTLGITQLDGFDQEVRKPNLTAQKVAEGPRTSIALPRP